MKKYPVTYKRTEYEIRWEDVVGINYICIYKVFKCKAIRRKFYIYKYGTPRFIVDAEIPIFEDDPNYYIEEAKTIFKIWERDEEDKQKAETIKANKEKALEEWDGIIC